MSPMEYVNVPPFWMQSIWLRKPTTDYRSLVCLCSQTTLTQPPTLIPSNHPPLQLVELCILFLQNSGLLELSFFLYTLLLNEANEVLIEIFSFARGFDFS